MVQKAHVNNSKGKPSLGLYIAIAAVLIAVIVVGFFAFRVINNSSSGRDSCAVVGQLEGKSQEEVEAERGRTVEEGTFDTVIASQITLDDGTSEGEFAIENVPGNHYLMKVTITRDDTGDVVYESGIIEPDHHIQRTKLAKDLDAGSYDCTAVFTALDPGTEAAVGQAAEKVTIAIKG